MAKTTALTLRTQDLQEAGITTALNQNDLIEVVANEIYEKFMGGIHQSKLMLSKLDAQHDALFEKELTAMHNELIKSKYLAASEKVDLDFDSVQRNSDYWPGLYVPSFKVEDGAKGTYIEWQSQGHKFSCPNLKKHKCIVRLKISNKDTEKDSDIKLGSITGTIEKTVIKNFAKEVEIPMDRFKKFQQGLVAYVEFVESLKHFIPKHGPISIERFTREARVKMNKSILSTQPKEFKEKMYQLFNISL